VAAGTTGNNRSRGEGAAEATGTTGNNRCRGEGAAEATGLITGAAGATAVHRGNRRSSGIRGNKSWRSFRDNRG
jgi:hypothetical protein